MTNTLTPNKLFQEPASGDTGWNVPLNFNFTTMDQVLGSSFPISTTGGTTALTTSTAASNNVYWWTAQQLSITGTLTSNATITIPTTLGSGTFGGSWIIYNGTTGSFTLTFQTATGTGVTINQSSSAYVYSNGTNVLYADNNVTSSLTNPTFGNVTVTGTENIAGVTTVGLPSAQTVTITVASPAQVTATTVPVVNTPVVFTTTGALPTGLTAGTTYYVLNPTATTFNVAATVGGTAINTSGTQSGVQTATFSSQFADALNISSSSKLSLSLPNIAENATIFSTSGATGTINYDVLTQSVLYYTAAATGDWTINVRGNSLTTLNALMGIGQSITLAFLALNQTASAQTTTITIATPAVFTVTTAPANGTPVAFSTTGALPTGLTAGTIYYVINSSGSTFNVAATVGGSAIATSGTQSGTQTATFYGLFNNVFQIDGSSVTPKWQGGSAPTYGNNASIDVYTYTILKTAASTYTVFASLTLFK